MAASGEGAVEAGRQADDICGDVGEDSWCGLVVVGDLKPNPWVRHRVGEKKNKRLLHSADLGETSRLLPDCEPSTEHLSPGVTLSRWMGGQTDGTQGDQVWISEENREEYRPNAARYEQGGFSMESPGITRLPPRCQQDEIVVFPHFTDRWCGHAIEGVFLIHLHDRLTLPKTIHKDFLWISLWNSEHEFKPL